MTCRDCKLYDIQAVTDKGGRVQRKWVAKCLWVSTETWPLSVQVSMNRRPTATNMQPDDGHGCQRFIKRENP